MSDNNRKSNKRRKIVTVRELAIKIEKGEGSGGKSSRDILLV